MTLKFKKGDRVRMIEKHTIYSSYAGELGTVVGYNSLGGVKVQMDSSVLGHLVMFPEDYFELYFRKEVHDPEPARDYETEIFVLQERIQRLNTYIAKLEDDGFKYRRALVEIQMKTQEVLRPIPFQEDEECY